MRVDSKRVVERGKIEKLLKFLHEYAYFETIVIVSMYLGIGYLVDPTDICMVHTQASYILILLAIITLFHGFENGVLTLTILAFFMWFTYDVFDYVKFLVALMLTMIFSEFHYYWSQKIKKAVLSAEYKNEKLNELSKAFYTLKISHDQLEKNYVVKPMSIRNSIEYVINKNREIQEDSKEFDKNSAYYGSFLGLLEKSFNVNSALILYKKDMKKESLLSVANGDVALNTKDNKFKLEELFNDYLIDKAISRKTAVFVSDAEGKPTTTVDSNSDFIAAIPILKEQEVIGVLAIEKMPFMAFNRENLTSIALLLEYFSIEINKKNVLEEENHIEIIPDEAFRFEYARLTKLYKKYSVNSILIVLRINNELQATRIYEKVLTMLRSLDMAAYLENEDLYYVTLMFPLQDKAAALGYINRLLFTLEEEKDKKFHYMTFTLNQTQLFNKYLREDYNE